MTKNFLHYIYIYIYIFNQLVKIKQNHGYEKKNEVKEIGMAFQDYSQVKETQKQFIPLSQIYQFCASFNGSYTLRRYRPFAESLQLACC